jgi:RND family efflux transporter MFP subunit
MPNPSASPDLSSLRIDRGSRTHASPSGGAGRALLWIVPVALVVVAATWFVFLRPSGTPVTVALAEATGGGSALSSEGITANGYVVARTRASVSAKILGRLATLRVAEGSRVRRGDVLATIEDADYQAALNVARAAEAQFDAELVQARRDLERARTLRAQNLIAEAEIENLSTRVDVLAAQARSARAQTALTLANLENTRVRAPFDGTVLRKDAEVGEIVAPSSAGGGLTRTAIVTMADLGTLEVEVDVSEAYIARIRNGQPGRVTLDAYPDTSFAARVRQVVPTADRQKATVQVKVSILDRDPRILPEMGAKVTFAKEAGAGPLASAAARRVLGPEGAVVRAGEAATVWVVVDGVARERAVDLGPVRESKVEIRRGLEGGEQVVVRPPAGLREGARVRVVPSS